MPRKGSNWERKGARIGGSIGAIASKVSNIISELNVEHKHYDVIDLQTPDYNGVVTLLCGVTQGVADSQRTGDSVKFTSVSIREGINCSSSDVVSFVRSIYFYDRRPVLGVNPAVDDVLQLKGQVYAYLAPYSKKYPGRFKIMSDETMAMSSISAYPFFRKNHFSGDVKVKWADSTALNISVNPIFHLVISDQAATPPTVNAYVRLRYVDN